MATKHMQMCSASLRSWAIKEIIIKNPTRQNYKPNRTARVKNWLHRGRSWWPGGRGGCLREWGPHPPIREPRLLSVTDSCPACVFLNGSCSLQSIHEDCSICSSQSGSFLPLYPSDIAPMSVTPNPTSLWPHFPSVLGVPWQISNSS